MLKGLEDRRSANRDILEGYEPSKQDASNRSRGMWLVRHTYVVGEERGSQGARTLVRAQGVGRDGQPLKGLVVLQSLQELHASSFVQVAVRDVQLGDVLVVWQSLSLQRLSSDTPSTFRESHSSNNSMSAHVSRNQQKRK